MVPLYVYQPHWDGPWGGEQVTLMVSEGHWDTVEKYVSVCVRELDKEKHI